MISKLTNWPKACPKLLSCFIKRVHRKTLLKWLWLSIDERGIFSLEPRTSYVAIWLKTQGWISIKNSLLLFKVPIRLFLVCTKMGWELVICFHVVLFKTYFIKLQQKYIFLHLHSYFLALRIISFKSNSQKVRNIIPIWNECPLRVQNRFGSRPKTAFNYAGFFSFDPSLIFFWCSTNFFGLAQDSYGPIKGQGRGYFKNKQ